MKWKLRWLSSKVLHFAERPCHKQCLSFGHADSEDFEILGWSHKSHAEPEEDKMDFANDVANWIIQRAQAVLKPQIEASCDHSPTSDFSACKTTSPPLTAHDLVGVKSSVLKYHILLVKWPKCIATI